MLLHSRTLLVLCVHLLTHIVIYCRYSSISAFRRFALSDFYSSGPCTSPANRGCVLSALQTGVRTGSSPTPAALLQASRAGAQSPALSAGSAVAAAGRGAKRESLQSAVTRSHLEDSLGAAVLLGSAEEFMDVLKAYAGHLAKNAAFGDGRLVGYHVYGVHCRAKLD